MSRQEWKEPDDQTLRILMATDNHLGYLEEDAVRKMDSFKAMDEIMRIAEDNHVDFVLLGGDLFHDNNPSRFTLYKTMEIFRKRCFGNKDVNFQVVSNQSINFPETGCVNYEDPDVNVSMPVFTIHGNHDDPVGMGGYSAMDILNRCNLVNYFGKAEQADNIECFPVLLTKGDTKLALYGIGNIRDERLHRTFAANKVKWVRPNEDRDDWFNIGVVHQNRTKHSGSQKNFISEDMLPGFFDMVLWGHEHECKVEPEESYSGDYIITQPGSSVATSLSQGEAAEKFVGLVDIKGQRYRMKPVKLHHVRPFKIRDVRLKDFLDPEEAAMDQDAIEKVLADVVEEMIEEAKQESEGVIDPSMAELPLIRLRTEYSGFDKLNVQRFGQPFVGRVANPDSILLFFKTRANVRKSEKKKKSAQDAGSEAMMEAIKVSAEGPNIDGLILEALQSRVAGLSILSENMLNHAVRDFVSKKETKAIDQFVEQSLKTVVNTIQGNEDVEVKNENDVETLVEGYMEENEINLRGDLSGSSSDPEEDDEDDSDAGMQVVEKKRKLNKPKAKKASPKKKKAAPKKKKAHELVDSEDSYDDGAGKQMDASDSDGDVFDYDASLKVSTRKKKPASSSSSSSKGKKAGVKRKRREVEVVSSSSDDYDQYEANDDASDSSIAEVESPVKAKRGRAKAKAKADNKPKAAPTKRNTRVVKATAFSSSSSSSSAKPAKAAQPKKRRKLALV